MLLVGLGAALLASVLFNVGIVLQAVDARVAPRSLGYRLGLLTRLLRRPRWVLGWLLGIGLALMHEWTDARFLTPADVASSLNITVIGSAPAGLPAYSVLWTTKMHFSSRAGCVVTAPTNLDQTYCTPSFDWFWARA